MQSACHTHFVRLVTTILEFWTCDFQSLIISTYSVQSNLSIEDSRSDQEYFSVAE